MGFFNQIIIPLLDTSFYSAANGFINWIFLNKSDPVRLAYKNLSSVSKKLIEDFITNNGTDWQAINIDVSKLKKEKEYISISAHDLHRALDDLNFHRYIEIVSVIGNKYWGVKIKPEMYFVFGKLFMNFDIKNDAKKLAEVILTDSKFYMPHTLHSYTTWNKKRFNVALAYLINICDLTVSETIQTDGYPVYQICPDLQHGKYNLKEFLK